MADNVIDITVKSHDQTGPGFDSVGRRTSNLGGILKSFAIGAAGALAVVGVGAVSMGMSFVKAAEESQKVTRQTQAVITSMGGAAGVTADQVAKLSEKLSMQTGIDDELIQSGQNMLLTFGNIRNGAGENEKMFDRATKATLDMSVAMGQDMTQSAVQVGKALNDPIAGLSALSRVGVQFTDDQKRMIEGMVEAGDTMGAQGIILGELERQFGGSAEAQATASDRLRTAWGNLQETLGEMLLPLFERVVQWLIEDGIPAFQDFAAEVEEHVVPILQRFAEWFREDFLPAAQRVVDYTREELLPIWQGIAEFIRGELVPQLHDLWENMGDIVSIFRDTGSESQSTTDLLGYLLDALRWASILAAAVTASIGGIVGVLSTLAGWLRPVISLWWEVQSTLNGAVIGAFKAVAGAIMEVVGAAGRAAGAVGSLMDKLDSVRSGPLGILTTGSLLGFLPKKKAQGGITGAQAGGVRGGMHLVGEHGPELVRIPSGSMVHSNAMTSAMLGAGGGGSIVLRIESGPDPADQLLADLLRRIVKVDFGGDVQAALGYAR